MITVKSLMVGLSQVIRYALLSESELGLILRRHEIAGQGLCLFVLAWCVGHGQNALLASPWAIQGIQSTALSLNQSWVAVLLES